MKVEDVIKHSGIIPYKTSGSCEGVFYLNQVEEIARLYADQFMPTTTTETMQCDEGCEYHCTKGETLQEGDWTKCQKFSEWVSLLEIDGITRFDESDFDFFNKYDGRLKFSDERIYYSIAENFLPYQEFKKRAENTFKTK